MERDEIMSSSNSASKDYKKIISLLNRSIIDLNTWIEKNGFSGYDPYDIKGVKWIRESLYLYKKNFYNRIRRFIVGGLVTVFPSFLRKVVGVKPQINPKAMGLMAKAYLNLYLVFKEQVHLEKAKEILQWLKKHPSVGYSEKYCWGYPFDWQSCILIPKGTPSSVVTSICGDAFYAYYNITRSKESLNICKSICNFFIKDLNISYNDNNEICFSYTPLDSFKVHNANLFVAEYLIRIGKEVENESFIKYGLKAVQYTIKRQNPDGSFAYWGEIDRISSICATKLNTVDHYHTGFVLRSLFGIYKITKDRNIKKALDKGYEFYKKNLFDQDKIPVIMPGKKYPIDIHSCAEAIITMSVLSEVYEDSLQYAMSTFFWARKHMQDKKGFFYFRKYKFWIDKTPYIRWGQAWMLLALSQLKLSLSHRGRNNNVE